LNVLVSNGLFYFYIASLILTLRHGMFSFFLSSQLGDMEIIISLETSRFIK